MIQKIRKIKNVKGELKLPGDKSISHRSVFFSSMSKGQSKITNLLESADIYSSIDCFRELGAQIEQKGNDFFVSGCGFGGFREPKGKLDAGNSGTTARLISGVLAAQKFSTVMVGDESLSKRPMKRIADPLKLMGSDIELTDNGTLPARFIPADKLSAIEYVLPVASAQVKSAVLLAGLHLEEETRVIENFETRNHTEKMLDCNVVYESSRKIISISKKNYPEAKEYTVPSDISTASFFIVLTLLAKNSEMLLKDVSFNRSRTGILEILRKMGANISNENERVIAGEELGDLLVRSSSLKNIEIEKGIIPNIIDEIPILSVVGLIANGDFIVKNAKELRFKESDRIKSLCHNYKLLGLDVDEFEDGFKISGEIKNLNVTFESFGDHRIAMAFAILSTLLLEEAAIKDFECVGISNPNFLPQLQSITE